MLRWSGLMRLDNTDWEGWNLSESGETDTHYAMDVEETEPGLRSRAAYLLEDGKSTCAMVVEGPDGRIVSSILMTSSDPVTYSRYYALARATTLVVRPGYHGGPSTRTGFLALVAEVREYVITQSAELTLDT